MTQIPIRAPLAAQAVPGLELDPYRPGFPRQVIVTAEWDNDVVTVTTEHGTWKFDRWDFMTFPRRPDGSVKNWNNESGPPRPFDLCVMDILPPADIPPDFHNVPEHERERVKKLWRDQASQIVTGIWTGGSIDHAVIKTFTPIDRQLRMWHFGMNEPVMFPRANVMIRHEVDRNRETYGPYLRKIDPDIIVEFYVHPSGRGRWPSAYREFWLPNEPGTYKMRPPILIPDWKRFVLAEKGHPHPNDPKLRKKAKVGASIQPEYARDY